MSVTLLSALDNLSNSDVVDLTNLTFSFGDGLSASGGTFLKCLCNGKYYKLSSFNDVDGEYGYESVCEIVANRVCECFGVSYLKQELIHARVNISGHDYIVWLVRSDNYKRNDERRITLEALCVLNGIDKYDKAQVFDFISKQPYKNDILDMMLIDYVINNRDRHGANIELLCTPNGNVRVAPVFDCGSSLVAPLFYDIETIRNYNVLQNNPVNNFILSMFYDDIIPYLNIGGKLDVDLSTLQLSDLSCAFKHDGDIILDAMKNMVIKRWEHAKNIWTQRH